MKNKQNKRHGDIHKNKSTQKTPTKNRETRLIRFKTYKIAYDPK